MADVIDYQIYGDDLQLVEITLDPREGVRAEAGAMMYMEHGIELETSSGSGFMSGFKRVLSGENFFITNFANVGDRRAKIAFAAPYPGKIIPLDLEDLGGVFFCQRSTFLCAASGTEIDVEFIKRFGVGVFGGEGFILQRLRGDGMAFIHAGGTIIPKELAPGEELRVDTGCVVAFSPSVHYDIESIRGVKNVLFGGEGLFLVKLTGPGTIYLQSLPVSRLAAELRQYMPVSSSSSS